LRGGASGLRFVHLSLEPAQALERVAARPGHFYPASLVSSQFQALEDPSGEAGVLVVNATAPLDEVAGLAAQWLQDQQAA
jgi:gluconokinase